MPVCARLVYKSSVPVKVSRSASYQMKYTESNPTELHEGRCRRVNNACGTHSAQHIASSSTSFPLSSVCKSCQSCAPSRHHPWLGWHAVLFFLLFPPLFPPPTFLFPFHYVCSRLAALDPFDVSCIWYRIAWSQPIYLDESRNERNLLSLSLCLSAFDGNRCPFFMVTLGKIEFCRGWREDARCFRDQKNNDWSVFFF